MPSPTSTSAPGLHGPFIQGRLPDWLKHATADDLARLQRHWLPGPLGSNAELATYQAQSRRSTAALGESLKALQGIAGFAEPLLKARLNSELGLELEVNTVEFVQIQRDSILLGSLLQTRPRQQSLLQAALQNFAGDAEIDSSSGLAGRNQFGLELLPGSGQGAPRFRYRFHERLAVAPQRFARLCHALDLGGRYQAHLREVFESPATQAEVRARWISAQRDQLRVAIQTAFVRQEISAAAREALLALAQGERGALFNGKPLRISQLKMFEKPLADVLVISADRTASDQQEPVLVYMPGAPLYPLKEYPSAKAAQDDLRINLRLPAFQQLLRGYLLQSDQAHVFSRLEEALYHLVEDRDGVYQRQANPNGKLYLREMPVEGELFAHLFERHLFKLKADARLLAVPSADADEQAREARLRYWESIGFNLLNAAAFFIPALGVVMAAVTAVQVVREVIVGVEDWEHGDLAQAWEHLSAVGLNLALMAGLGMAGHTALPLRSSALLDGLLKVPLPGGGQRLWRPTLAPYAVDVELAGVAADAQGVYLKGTRRYVRIESSTYQVEADARGIWRLQHPSDSSAYQPELRHNGQGAWRLHGENPLHWQGLQLWRRLGRPVEGLSDEDLRQVAGISGISDDRLRRLHLDSEALPPLLEEALARRQMHRRVDDLIGLLRQGRTRASALPLAVLTRMPSWPPGVLVQVMDGERLLMEYGQSLASGNRTLVLQRAQLSEGGFLLRILALLSETEQKGLVGPYLETDDAARTRQLCGAIADFAALNRSLIFDSLYRSEAISEIPLMQALRRDFPGLPRRLAKALALRARGREREQLLGSPGRVPLRLAEEARWLLEEVRLNQACEGLYNGYQDSADIRRLALGELEHLPGWRPTLRFELRETSWRGRLLDSIGAPDASHCKYLVERRGGYQALDSQGQELGGVESLYAAILHALPDAARSALDLPIDQPDTLRLRLAQLAQADRAGARRLLRQRPRTAWLRPPLRLTDERFGYPLSGRGDASALRSPALLEQVRLLCPELDLVEINRFLDQTGVPEAQLPGWLRERGEQLAQLRNALAEWHEALPAASRNDGLYGPGFLRTEFESSWRRQLFGRQTRLQLPYLFEQLPSLPIAFERIVELDINGSNLSELSAGFLAAFPRLRSLRLGFSNLAQIPPALFELSGLESLSLNQSYIELDAAAVAGLARLTRLRTLNLAGNPLGDALDVSSLVNLQTLSLENTQISRWPSGVLRLPALELLDMRSCQIREIPVEVLDPAPEHEADVTEINRQTYINDNPLAAESRSRLASYYRRTRISLGLEPGPLLQASPEVFAEPQPLQASQRWLRGTPVEQRGGFQQHWDGLAAEPGNAAFFGLLSELRETSDFKLAFDSLRTRVWNLLAAACANTELREELFEIAGHPETCGDGVILIFSRMEVRVLVYQAMLADSAQGAERALIGLGRGLYRLDALERIALRDIAARLEGGGDPDQVEVHLAYRTGLAEALELPGQPHSMSHRPIAGVSAERLEAARLEVLAAESAQSLQEDLVARPFWVEFLKAHYAPRFEAMNETFYAQANALNVNNDREYLDGYAQIAMRQADAEKALVRSLTEAIWARLA